MTELGEIAPGLFIDAWVPDGRVFKLAEDDPMIPHSATAVSPTTWYQIDPVVREEIRDYFIRRASTTGQMALELYLAKL